jgi:hypothetical protein
MSKERLEHWKTQLKQAEWATGRHRRQDRIDGCKRKIAHYQAKLDAEMPEKPSLTKGKMPKLKEGDN